jgi:hypothetical protein
MSSSDAVGVDATRDTFGEAVPQVELAPDGAPQLHTT